jgi:hypothetical protein
MLQLLNTTEREARPDNDGSPFPSKVLAPNFLLFILVSLKKARKW